MIVISSAAKIGNSFLSRYYELIRLHEVLDQFKIHAASEFISVNNIGIDMIRTINKIQEDIDNGKYQNAAECAKDIRKMWKELVEYKKTAMLGNYFTKKFERCLKIILESSPSNIHCIIKGVENKEVNTVFIEEKEEEEKSESRVYAPIVQRRKMRRISEEKQNDSCSDEDSNSEAEIHIINNKKRKQNFDYSPSLTNLPSVVLQAPTCYSDTTSNSSLFQFKKSLSSLDPFKEYLKSSATQIQEEKIIQVEKFQVDNAMHYKSIQGRPSAKHFKQSLDSPNLKTKIFPKAVETKLTSTNKISRNHPYPNHQKRKISYSQVTNYSRNKAIVTNEDIIPIIVKMPPKKLTSETANSSVSPHPQQNQHQVSQNSKYTTEDKLLHLKSVAQTSEISQRVPLVREEDRMTSTDFSFILLSAFEKYYPPLSTEKYVPPRLRKGIKCIYCDIKYFPSTFPSFKTICSTSLMQHLMSCENADKKVCDEILQARKKKDRGLHHATLYKKCWNRFQGLADDTKIKTT